MSTTAMASTKGHTVSAITHVSNWGKCPGLKWKTQKENDAMAVKSEIIFLRKYSNFPDFATGDHENDVAVCYLLKSVNVWLRFVRRS